MSDLSTVNSSLLNIESIQVLFQLSRFASYIFLLMNSCLPQIICSFFKLLVNVTVIPSNWDVFLTLPFLSGKLLLTPQGQIQTSYSMFYFFFLILQQKHCFPPIQFPMCVCVCVCHSVVSDSLRSSEQQPAGLLHPWNSPVKNTGVGSLSIHQGISPTQGSNPSVQHCRQFVYHLSYQGSIQFPL